MQVIKFVTEDFKSPGEYRKLDYSKFGIPIEVDVDPEDYGQCGRGIHVVPINEDADLTNVIFTGTMILLVVEECEIVYCEGNGKMRVRKATPIRQIVETDEEWGIIRTAIYRDPGYTYNYAKYVDRKPTDETRTVACQNAGYAYMYALHIDRKPTDETRTAACKDPVCAYDYARKVDKCPTDETRTAACKNSGCAYDYAREVDKKPTDETRTAACKSSYYAYMYARHIDKKHTEETRIATSKDEYWKEQYELYWRMS
jgi:hypothetical protein